MATIRVRDWTKEQIEEIREAESHSSHDSVIKALLKDRELAQFAGTAADGSAHREPNETNQSPDKAFENLTVLRELEHADNGVVFLWCPSCAKEIAHIGFDDDISMSVFEVECQRCLVRLDQHVLVGIEVGYPIEERIVEGTAKDDLKECVIDYWDRSLEAAAVGVHNGDDVDDDYLVRRYNEYLREFGWRWPEEVPVVGVQPNEWYRNTVTGDTFEVLEAVSEKHGELNDYHIRRYTDDGKEETTILEASDLTNLVVSRNLTLAAPEQQ